MINVPGSPVTADRFWDRKTEMALFIKTIEDGGNVLLVAQRRIGKTSFMKEAQLRLKNDYICLFVDLQGAEDAKEFVVLLSLAMEPYNGLRQRVYKVFANVFAAVKNTVEQVECREVAIKLRQGVTEANWRDKASQLLDILAKQEKPVLILLDEVPIMVNRILKGGSFDITAERKMRADEFMSWLRKESIKHAGKIRMVVAGSIGFEPVLHQANLSATINNFQPFELNPWNDDVAIGCLNELADEYGVEFEPDVPSKIVSKLGCCIPHHVQVFFSHIYAKCKREGQMTVNANDVEEIYQGEMLGATGQAHLMHYEEKLKHVLPDNLLRLAIELLSEAAVAGCLGAEQLTAIVQRSNFTGTHREDALSEILSILEHDGYIKRSAKGYIFVSNLLRDWWRKKYELVYTPVLKGGR